MKLIILFVFSFISVFALKYNGDIGSLLKKESTGEDMSYNDYYNLATYYYEANLHNSIKYLKKAQEKLEQMNDKELDKSQEKFELLLVEADFYHEMKDFENSILLTELALEIKPDNRETIHNLGILNHEIGNFELAKELIEKADVYNQYDEV